MLPAPSIHVTEIKQEVLMRISETTTLVFMIKQRKTIEYFISLFQEIPAQQIGNIHSNAQRM